MTRIIVIFAVVLASMPSFAAWPTNEESVVRDMSEAAERNQLGAFLRTVDLPRISASSKGQCTPETVFAIGKLLAVPGATFETRSRGDLRAVRATTRDHITAFFSLHSTDRTLDEPEGHLVIVAVDVRFPESTP
jgi:hypothetical protein